MTMTGQQERNLPKPNILIVGADPILCSRLRNAFRPKGIAYESARSAKEALKRLDEGEPPITGVLTNALRGDYAKVLEAAREIGAHAVLMTHSSLTVSRAQQEDIPAYLIGQFAGRTREGNETIGKLIMDLAPLPEISPDL
jgi:DNA-binding NtrC family response regulator